jgi:hypothetical protein
MVIKVPRTGIFPGGRIKGLNKLGQGQVTHGLAPRWVDRFFGKHADAWTLYHKSPGVGTFDKLVAVLGRPPS